MSFGLLCCSSGGSISNQSKKSEHHSVHSKNGQLPPRSGICASKRPLVCHASRMFAIAKTLQLTQGEHACTPAIRLFTHFRQNYVVTADPGILVALNGSFNDAPKNSIHHQPIHPKPHSSILLLSTTYRAVNLTATNADLFLNAPW